MKFPDKKKAYHQMQNADHLKCDRDLLARKAPKSVALTIGLVNKEKAQRDILWALLDVATIEEIEANRKPEVVNEIPVVNPFLQKLLDADLANETQPKMAAIARGLKLETPDYKAVTLRIVLDDYRFKLSLDSKEAESNTDKVNELVDKNEQLKGELEEKELENEDLQEQLEDAEAEKELLEEQLEEEKKSEATPDPE